MNLMRFAALLAQKRESEKLSLKILSDAYAKRLSKHMVKENPFLASPDTSYIVPPPQPLKNAPEGIGRRSAPRKIRKPSVAQVLKAK